MASRDYDDDDDERYDDEEDDRKSSKKRRGKATPEDKQMAMFCHLGGIIGGFILPLVIWLMKKEESKFVDDQGKEALNFQITMILAHMTIGLITCGIGSLILLPLGLVFCIMGATAANRGEYYRYPMNIRFIK